MNRPESATLSRARQAVREAERAEHWAIKSLAAHWGVSRSTVARLVACGALKAHRVGRVWRVAPEEIQRYEQRLADAQRL